MMVNNLDVLLESSFKAISVLLVFVTMLFNSRYSEIGDILNEPIIRDKTIACEKQRKKILNTLLYKWMPVVLLIGVCTYTMTPLAIETICGSEVRLFNFDFIRTAFVLVWGLNLSFFILSLHLAYKLYVKYRPKPME